MPLVGEAAAENARMVEARESLWKAVNGLPDDYRMVILLRQHADLDFLVIAERIQRSPHEVRLLWGQAILDLRAKQGASEKLTELLLTSLLKYDEALRNGRPNDSLVFSMEPGFQENLERGQTALDDLEAAIPRRSRAMLSWAPKNIGRFELQSVLGAGAFAVVYLARDPQLSRLVALKVPRPHALVNPGLRRQFVIEAQAAAKLDHPNIVAVYEAGQDGDLPYIACTWCDGPTLETWLAERTTPLKPALAATIIRQLADALRCSHEHGILHRDIKPGNVLLFPLMSAASEEFPFVPRLSDFGLAKLMESSELDAMTSQLVGTPHYMAPELLNGTTQPAKAAADIYALGSVLYCLIVGQPPFVAATTAETFRLITECDPVAPDSINRGIGRDLSLICLKCLEKELDQRYASASGLVDDLDRFLAGKPVLARSKSLPVRIQKWCRQRPLVAILLLTSGSLVVLLLITAVLYTGSLRNLQGQLKSRNEDLRGRVKELALAVEASAQSTAAANRQRRTAERLLFAADVKHASQIWKKGDARETIRILSKYAGNRQKDSGSINGRDHFAWRLLWNQATNACQEIFDAQQSVWWLQRSPDGRHLVISGSSGKLQFLAIDREFELDHTLQASAAEIGCVTYSDDAQFFATACDDGKVQIWDAQTRQLVRDFEAIPGHRVFVVLFLLDSHQLLACGESTTLTLWDADTGMLIREIATPFERPIEFMTFSPDRTRLLMAGADGCLVQMKLEDYSILSKNCVSSRRIAMACYSADGSRIVCAGIERIVRMVDAESDEILFSAHNQDTIHAVLYIPDDRVVLGDRGGVLSIFPDRAASEGKSPEDWRSDQRWAGHDSRVTAMAWLPNTVESGGTNGQLVTSDRSGVVRAWDITRTVHVQVIPSSVQFDYSVPCAITPAADSSKILRGGPNGLCLISMDADTGPSCCLPDRDITAVRRVGVKGRVVVADTQGALTSLNINTPQTAKSVQVFSDRPIEQVSTDTDGNHAVALGPEGLLAVVSLVDSAVTLSLTDRSASAISPDGDWVVTSRRGTNDLEIFARDGMRSICCVPAHHSTVNRVVFSPDGKYFVTTSDDRMINVWSCATWNVHHQLSGHQSYVSSATVASDCQTLATGDEDGVIKLWDLVSGRELMELDQIVEDLAGLEFSMDGQTLIAWDARLNITVLLNPPLNSTPRRL